MSEDSRYRLTVHLTALDHLAEGLYSSVAAVLTETVANAWDADATRIDLDFDLDNDRLGIEDNGIGMDESDINHRFLAVGYKKRQEQVETPRGRPVMGRKGIGKLSLFSLARSLDIVSNKEGSPQTCGLRIDYNDLREAMEQQRSEYRPKEIPGAQLSDRHGRTTGTSITLTRLRSERLRETRPESLRRRLARRFSILGTDEFRVFVDGVEVTGADRGDLNIAEYAWFFRETEVPDNLSASRQTDLENRLDAWSPDQRVTGWIASARTPKALRTAEGNLNSIVLMARGRLVHEDILPFISSAEMSGRYITGQIEANFLDESDQADIVTSDRQRLKEDDQRVETVIALAKKAMNRVGKEWLDLRSSVKRDHLRDKFPGIDEWLAELPSRWADKAESLLNKMCVIEIDDEKDRFTLVKNAVLGFERLRLNGEGAEGELEKAMEDGVEHLLKLFADRDALEASFYHDIVKNRIAVIRSFQRLKSDDQKERVLQEYLFDHLWLLDPAWERASDSSVMEEQLRLRAEFADDNETKGKFGRVDIRYRTVAGKHVIVELKRASVKSSVFELAEQGSKYVDALKDLVVCPAEPEPSIEVVFVVGRMPQAGQSRISSIMQGVSPGSTIRTYDQLIGNALRGYEEYLQKAQHVDRIERLLSSVDEGADAGPAEPSEQAD